MGPRHLGRDKVGIKPLLFLCGVLNDGFLSYYTLGSQCGPFLYPHGAHSLEGRRQTTARGSNNISDGSEGEGITCWACGQIPVACVSRFADRAGMLLRGGND